MFGSQKRKAARALNETMTTTGLLKAALAQDNDAMTAMVTGQTADDEGVRFALETFIMVAHRNPAIVSRLQELQSQMPAKTQGAFDSGIRASREGNVRLFQGGNILGQGLFIISLAAAISEDTQALSDALATVAVHAESG